MNIQKIDSYNKPAFQSAHRVYFHNTVKNSNFFESKYIHTNTNLFREDLNWIDLINYAVRHFADKPKVNTYSMACSDGSEAYTFAITLMEKAPQNIISKFLPIKAFDVDSEMIDSAKSGKINILGEEFKLIEQLGINLKKYFINPTKPKQYSNDELYYYVNSASYDIAKCLSDTTEFKQSDILTEIQNIKDDSNSIVMCRNVLPYLDDNYVNKIIETAKNKLKDGSLFIVGNYEHSKTYNNGLEFEEMLCDNGFYQPFPNHYNIFERISKERISRLPLRYFVS